jgi:hypothetical protein
LCGNILLNLKKKLLHVIVLLKTSACSGVMHANDSITTANQRIYETTAAIRSVTALMFGKFLCN